MTWASLRCVTLGVSAAVLAACGGEAADGLATTQAGPTVAASAGPQVATGRTLAYIAGTHLNADQARRIEGYGTQAGASAVIDLTSGPGDRLYLQSTSPDYGPPPKSCAVVERRLRRGEYTMTSCESFGSGLVYLTSSPPGDDHTVLGHHSDATGEVAAWVATSRGDQASSELLLAILRDPRLGFEVGAGTFNAAASLANYEDVNVKVELHSDRDPQ